MRGFHSSKIVTSPGVQAQELGLQQPPHDFPRTGLGQGWSEVDLRRHGYGAQLVPHVALQGLHHLARGVVAYSQGHESLDRLYPDGVGLADGPPLKTEAPKTAGPAGDGGDLR